MSINLNYSSCQHSPSSWNIDVSNARLIKWVVKYFTRNNFYYYICKRHVSFVYLENLTLLSKINVRGRFHWSYDTLPSTRAWSFRKCTDRKSMKMKLLIIVENLCRGATKCVLIPRTTITQCFIHRLKEKQ